MTAAVQPSRTAFEQSAPLGETDASALDAIGALQRETLGERVTGELRSLLVAGRLAPRCAASPRRWVSR